MATVERSISSLLNDVAGNVQDIVRSEVRLAKTEIAEEAGEATRAGISVASAALLFTFSLFFVLLAAVFALSAAMAPWAAALVVAACVGVVGALLFFIGIRQFRKIRAAPKTRATLQENAEWAKHPTR